MTYPHTIVHAEIGGGVEKTPGSVDWYDSPGARISGIRAAGDGYRHV